MFFLLISKFNLPFCSIKLIPAPQYKAPSLFVIISVGLFLVIC